MPRLDPYGRLSHTLNHQRQTDIYFDAEEERVVSDALTRLVMIQGLPFSSYITRADEEQHRQRCGSIAVCRSDLIAILRFYFVEDYI